MAIRPREASLWENQPTAASVMSAGVWTTAKQVLVPRYTETIYPDGPTGASYTRTLFQVAQDFVVPPGKTSPDPPTVSITSSNPSWVDDGGPAPQSDVLVEFDAIPHGPEMAVPGFTNTIPRSITIKRYYDREIQYQVGGVTELLETIPDPDTTSSTVRWSGNSGSLRVRMRYINDAGPGPWTALSTGKQVQGIDPI